MRVKAKLLEVIYGVLPIVLIITLLQLTIAEIPWAQYYDFLGGTVLVVCGLLLFLLGVEASFIPIGELLGSSLVGTGKIYLILLFGFIIGFAVTMPEPDVQVLATQASALSAEIDKNLLVFIIASGVGLSVALALFRIFHDIPVLHILIAGYALAFILLLFCPPEIATIAFDSGGVTTGSLTVPFIMSLGVGVASVTAKKSSSANSFGIMAIASMGSVLVVLVMGVLAR